MKKARRILIITHYVTSLLVHYSFLGQVMLGEEIVFDMVKPLYIGFVILIAIDLGITIALTRRLKNTLSGKDIVRLQLIDWPVALYGLLCIIGAFIGNRGIVRLFLTSIELVWVIERVISTLILLPKKDSVFNIDDIMMSIDCRKPASVQKDGVFMARSIHSTSAFIMPIGNVEVWANCAKIVSERSDIELRPYLYYLFQWVRSSDIPGADVIFSRLKRFQKDDSYTKEYVRCVAEALEKQDKNWIHYLEELK